MNTDLIPVVAAIVGPAITYLLAVRRMSGKIGTSQASDLWKESTAMRNEYRLRLQEAQDRIDALEQRVVKLEQENGLLALENLKLKQDIEELKANGQH